MQCHFPDNVVQEIAGQLLTEDNRAALLSLMSVCGVCRQWRGIAKRVENPVLRFDSLKACGRMDMGRALTDSERRFRGSSAQAKEALFQSAAQLLEGYSSLVLCGEGVTDVTIVEAARTNGAKLISVGVTVSLPVPSAFAMLKMPLIVWP